MPHRRVRLASTLHERSRPRKVAVVRSAVWMIAICVLLLASRDGLTAPIRYTIAVDRQFKAVTVDACFGAGVPAQLSLSTEVAPNILSGLSLAQRSRRSVYRATTVAKGCAHYALDLSGLPPGNPHAGFQRLTGAILIDPRWLLAVPHGGGSHTLELHFILPVSARISAPAEIRAEGAGRWRLVLDTRAWDRSGRLGIGRMYQAKHSVGGATLAVSVIGSLAAVPGASYAQWVTQIATTMSAAFGRFPVPYTQVLLVLPTHTGEAVPWGEVVRAGGDGVLLYVDRTRGVEQLAQDWVAFHEFSHLLHPFMGRRDSWWAEGLASYYQNVLRAHAGQLTPQAAWRELHAGFGRGRSELDGSTLAVASHEMMTRRHFMRVYWSGAAIALLADVELRLRTRNQHSLAEVLGQFSLCCLPVTREWTAREFMRRLDEIAGVAVFEPLLERNLGAPGFPDVSPAYAVLGLRDRAGELKIGGSAAERRLRKAIMGSD